MDLKKDTDMSKLTVAILKRELECRDLESKGKKAELIERLVNFLNTEPVAKAPHNNSEEKFEYVSLSNAPTSPSKIITFTSPSEAAKSPNVKAPSHIISSKKNGLLEKAVSPVKYSVNAPKAASPVKSPKSNTIDTHSSPSSPLKPTTSASVKRPAEESVVSPKKARLEKEDQMYTAVHLKRFTRPLNIETLKSKVEEYGNVKSFWMDKIRSFAYVVYETHLEARAAQDALNGYVFQSTIALVAKLETEEDVENGIEHASNQPPINPFPVQIEAKLLHRSSATSSRPRFDGAVKYTRTLPSISYRERSRFSLPKKSRI